MKHTMEDLPDCQAKVCLSFEAAEVDSAFEKVYQELNTRGQVRGFRPGKVPRTLLVRHFGADAIAESAWFDLLKDSLEEALEGVETVGEPDFGEPGESGIEQGKPLDVEFTVTLASRVALGDISGARIYRPDPAAGEEDVDRVLAELAESHAVETDTDRSTVEAGDAVTVSVSVAVEGDEKPAEAVEKSVVAGREGLMPPIGEKLLGRMLEQSFELEFTYPEDYPDGDVAGKSAKAAVVVKGIRDRKVPAIDDELAAAVDAERFATLAQLRDEVRRQAEAQGSEYSRTETELQVVKALMDCSTVEVAEPLVARLALESTGDMIRRLEHDGIPLDEVEPLLGLGVDGIQQVEMIRARRALETDALLDEVAKKHDLEVSEEEIDAAAQLYADENGMDISTVRQAQVLQPDFGERLLQNLRRKRTFDILFTAVDLQDIPVEEYRKIRDDLLRPKAEEEPETQPEEAQGEQVAETEVEAEAGRPAAAEEAGSEAQKQAEGEQES